MSKKELLSDECLTALIARRGSGPTRKRWREVAGEIGCSENTLHRLRSRVRGTRTDTLLRIAAYVGMPLECIYVTQ